MLLQSSHSEAHPLHWKQALCYRLRFGECRSMLVNKPYSEDLSIGLSTNIKSTLTNIDEIQPYFIILQWCAYCSLSTYHPSIHHLSTSLNMFVVHWTLSIVIMC